MTARRIAATIIIITIALAVATLLSATGIKKERYFYVGFTSNTSSGGIWLISEDGRFITCQYAMDAVKAQYSINGRVVITSVFEFKNKTDFIRFTEDYK